MTEILKPDAVVAILPDGSVRVSSAGSEVTFQPGSPAGLDYVTAARRRLVPVKPQIYFEYGDEDPATGRRTDH